MMLRRAFLASLLSSVSAPALAHLWLTRGGIGTGQTQKAISSVGLSPTTFTGGSLVNTVVGAITVAMSDGSAFSGTLAVDDTTHFKIVGSNLELATTVAAGSYPINITATQASATNSPFVQPFTVIGTGAGATVATRTFVNTAGSASPTPTPVQCGLGLDRGVLAAGSIVTPTVGGVGLATWQMDAITTWDDGSFKFGVCTMLLASMAAGATTQVSFVSSVGSWPTTSAVTLADAAAETQSDYKLALSSLHTAQWFSSNTQPGTFLQVGFTLSGGSVSGGLVVYNGANAGNGTRNLTNGSPTGGAPTSAANVTITGTTVTVNSGGSGYGFLGTNGQFVAGFQQAVTLFNSNGNYNGVQIVQYRKGPLVDAWRVRMPILDATSSTALTHMFAHIYVERWKTAGGALLAYRAAARITNASTAFTSSTYNYTFDLDWKVGSTVIRGATNSSAGYTTCMLNCFSSLNTLDSGGEAAGAVAAGRMDWAANDAALKAVILQLTSGEVDSLWPLIPKYLTTFDGSTKCGSALSAGTGLSYSNPPSIQAAFYPKSPANAEDSVLALAQPMGVAGVRCPAGAGGFGHNEALYAETIILWTLALKNGSTTAAQKWLAQARAAASNWAASMSSTPILDPTNLTVFNSVPAATQTFAHMPDNSTKDNTNYTAVAGYGNTFVENGSGGFGGFFSPYHLPRYALPLYVVEGDQMWLDSETFAASIGMFYPGQNHNFSSTRLCTLGSTAYNGLWCMTIAPRETFWLMMTLAGVVATMPATWADGSSNVEQPYFLYQLRNGTQFLNDFMPFTGTVVCNGQSIAKTIDLSATGNWDLQKYVDSTSVPRGETTEWIYLAYGGHALPWAAYLHQDQGSGLGVAGLKTLCNRYVINSHGMWAYTGGHYYADAPIQAQEYPGGGAAITASRAALDAANAGWPAIPMSIQGITLTSQATSNLTNVGVYVSCTSGNNTFDVASAGPSPAADTACGLMFIRGTNPGGINNGGTVYVDGSAIWFSTINIQNNGGSYASAPPTNFSLGTAYYLHNVGPAAGKVQQFTLHATKADALSGANPITPGSTVAKIQVWGAPNNTVPADSAGKGTCNSGPDSTGQSRGSIAYGMAGFAVQYAFKAPGDSVPYPALDSNVGVTNAHVAAQANITTILHGVGTTFKDEVIEALA